MKRRLKAPTVKVITEIFKMLDYKALGRIYCDEGGDAFWKAKRGPCQRLGINLAEVLLGRLKPGGRSLYVGAGVQEIPLLTMETLELGRAVAAFNLRGEEVTVLNHACKGLPFQFVPGDAGTADGQYDHVWIVSVLDDPERFPELSALSYGRANPVTFDVDVFSRERDAVIAVADGCLSKLQRPGLVTTSTEELNWITDWCVHHKVSCVVEGKDYPTAIVEDPICFIRVGEKGRKERDAATR